MWQRLTALVGAGLLAAGCQNTDDPSKGGYLSGINALNTGAYDRRLEDKRNTLEAERQRGRALDQDLRRSRAEQARLSEQTAAAERQRFRVGRLDGEGQFVDRGGIERDDDVLAVRAAIPDFVGKVFTVDGRQLLTQRSDEVGAHGYYSESMERVKDGLPESTVRAAANCCCKAGGQFVKRDSETDNLMSR